MINPNKNDVATKKDYQFVSHRTKKELAYSLD